MTNKARKILEKMKLRRLFEDPKARDRILGEFNRSTLDDVGPLGGNQGVAGLKDMIELEAGHDEFVKILKPSND